MIKIRGDTYYFDFKTKVGLFKSGENCFLIDAPLKQKEAEEILWKLQSEGCELKAIIITHAHSDHCATAAFLQENTGCEVYAPSLEADLIRNPALTKAVIRSEFIEDFAKRYELRGCDVKTIVGDKLSIGDVDFDIVLLPGQSMNQVGVATPDKVLFVSDALFDEEYIEKHKLLFYHDVSEQRKTLEKLKDLDFHSYVPAHGKIFDSVSEIADLNLKSIEKIEEFILSFLEEEKTKEDLLAAMLDSFSVKLDSKIKWFVAISALVTYLRDLQLQEKAEQLLKENKIVWKRNK